MPKRKPPSQRLERKLDETAKAIARVREDEKADRAAETERLSSESSKLNTGHREQNAGVRKTGGTAPAAPRRRKTV